MKVVQPEGGNAIAPLVTIMKQKNLKDIPAIALAIIIKFALVVERRIHVVQNGATRTLATQMIVLMGLVLAVE